MNHATLHICPLINLKENQLVDCLEYRWSVCQSEN